MVLPSPLMAIDRPRFPPTPSLGASAASATDVFAQPPEGSENTNASPAVATRKLVAPTAMVSPAESMDTEVPKFTELPLPNGDVISAVSLMDIHPPAGSTNTYTWPPQQP